MASINKIQPGQTLYDVKRNTGIQRWNGKWSVWPVFVKAVNIEEEWILASWNGNAPRKMYLHDIKSLRVKEPKD